MSMAKRVKPALDSLSWSLIPAVYFVFPAAGGGVLPDHRFSYNLVYWLRNKQLTIWQCIVRLVDHVEQSHHLNPI